MNTSLKWKIGLLFFITIFSCIIIVPSFYKDTPDWWRKLFESSGLLQVEHCAELDDADILYEELVRYEYEHNLDPFDVDICLRQMDWAKNNRPRKTLFVLTANKVAKGEINA